MDLVSAEINRGKALQSTGRQLLKTIRKEGAEPSEIKKVQLGRVR